MFSNVEWILDIVNGRYSMDMTSYQLVNTQANQPTRADHKQAQPLVLIPSYFHVLSWDITSIREDLKKRQRK